ncbi:MAG: GGDEF domain-containing protein [Nitrospiraceae bacterium]|nr:MAG: GGDEF domain-containing protein [Nitrospiraceae bacterium]
MNTIKSDSLHTLLKGVATLPSLPSIALRIIQEIKKDKSSLNDLAEIISYDPALTAKILRIANSSFYALPYKVDSIERAVHILGLEALKNIALSFAIVKGFKRNPVDEFDHELFWKRSITSAVSAEMIAAKLKMKREDTFVTPLLMDIGVLVTYLVRPDDYLRVINKKRASSMSTSEAEASVYGFDHQDVGSEILKKWGLPESIYMPIAYHHNKKDCPADLKNMVDILMLADIMSSVYHGNKSSRKFSELKQLLQEKLDITDIEVSEFVDQIAGKTVEILTSFELDPGDMKPYSQILQDANEELGKLNFSYEQLVMELKQAKEMAEKLAVEAWEAKEKLREVAIKDGLTNLYNHKHFQDIMDKELPRVERYAHVLSLIMIDIDYFKKINDTYGHPQGDVVLRAIADIFEQTVRKPDTTARYGGEEFAIILPETDIKGAVVLAERLRQIVEKLELKLGDKTVKITISLGVTTYDPGRGRKTKAEIIDAADKALYSSKKTGRNKLSIVM